MDLAKLIQALPLFFLTATTSQAATTLAGTAWYDGNTTNINPNPSTTGYWVPSGVGNITGLTFSPGDRNKFGSNSDTVYLQNFILPNPSGGAGASAYLTVIELGANKVVGSSTNTVTTVANASQSTATPFRFDSLALDATKTYALIFTTTPGIAGTDVSGIPASVGQQLADNFDLDPGAETTLLVETMRWGGQVNPGTNLVENTGVFTPGIPNPSGQFTNYDQWYTATFTSTNQILTELNSGTGTTTQTAGTPFTVAGFRKTNTGTYVINQANTNTGDVIVEQGTLQLAFPAQDTLSSTMVGAGAQIMLNNYGAQNQSSRLLSGSTLELNYGGGNFVTADNDIEGVGVVLKTGSGQVLLSGNNGFIGTLRINNGTLALNSPTATTGRPHVEINGTGSSLALGAGLVGATATIGSLSGNGVVRANFGMTNGFKTLEINQDITTEFSGVIQDNGARNINIIKSGIGILRLTTGANPYKGTTTINGGTLAVNGNNSGATGIVTVNNNGTLAGTGSIGGVTTIKSGGTLSAGDPTLTSTVGTLTFNANLTLEAASTSLFELSGATGSTSDFLAIDTSLLTGTPGNHDHIDVTGSLTLGDGSIIKISLLGYTVAWGDVFNLIDWSAVGNANANGFDPLTDFDFSEASIAAQGLLWQTDRFLSDGIIYVTPEPSRSLLLLLACVGLITRRRR